MNRREFFGKVLGTFVATEFLSTVSENIKRGTKMTNSSQLRKAVILNMVPGKTIEDKFSILADLGYQGVEVPPTENPKEIESLLKASKNSGICIHSVIYGGWDAPLSSDIPSIAEKGVNAVKSALRCAKALGADSVLLVPGIVDSNTPYKEAYERSQKRIKSLIPVAQNLGIMITIENVWNNFLLSPLEFARYIDELNSPWVQAYFDVGNVVGAFGFPQDWIRTLGKRIKKIHLKDFKLEGRKWVNLGEGDVNWAEVRKALDDIGYKGYVTAELPAGDEQYLRDLASRINRLLNID
jgi:L-ribulose-5-phosphate 3-epimerase